VILDLSSSASMQFRFEPVGQQISRDVIQTDRKQERQRYIHLRKKVRGAFDEMSSRVRRERWHEITRELLSLSDLSKTPAKLD
jgi:hypothetical protein